MRVSRLRRCNKSFRETITGSILPLPPASHNEESNYIAEKGTTQASKECRNEKCYTISEKGTIGK